MQFVAFEGVITHPAVEDLLRHFGKANPPAGVYVNSPGGSFEFFSVLGPAIKRKDIATISGNVRSSAIILALLGAKRYALPDATFFFHEVRTLVTDGNAVTVCDLEEALEYEDWMSGHQRESLEEWRHRMQQAQAWFLDFLSRETGVSVPTFLNLMRHEETLTVREAIRYGIVHEVIPAIPGS